MLREKGFYWLYVRQAFCRTYHLSVQQSKRKKMPCLLFCSSVDSFSNNYYQSKHSMLLSFVVILF